jgi:endoglucanase
MKFKGFWCHLRDTRNQRKNGQFRKQSAIAAVALVTLTGCASISWESPLPPNSSSPKATESSLAGTSSLPAGTAHRELLEESWTIYREQFIQEDGRVIDYEASDRSTSEGQAYAMLRAVIIDDPKTFALTLEWAENNLIRRNADGQRSDNLWVWLWGKDEAGNWGAIDSNFASDADIDAITALIWASRRWNRPEYLELARVKLQDLWEYSTIATADGNRYLLPGPKAAFVPSPTTLHLNPSYLAPYAFRLFAQVDSNRNWLSLVESSYKVLEESSQVSAVGLPSDWIALDTQTGEFRPLPPENKLQSVYSFDAYRVWWRVTWDAVFFQSPEARRYLDTATDRLETLWETSARIPARIDIQGQPTVTYDATSQYAMLYPAFRLLNPNLAEQLLDKKLLPRYQEGIWDDESAYYTQNLAWIGLLPETAIPAQLLRP